MGYVSLVFFGILGAMGIILFGCAMGIILFGWIILIIFLVGFWFFLLLRIMVSFFFDIFSVFLEFILYGFGVVDILFGL